MLKNLTIQNYALISYLGIGFSRGLSTVTGETGAGKSIILGALGLILGQRADAKSIQPNEDKCLIEGLFDIANYGLEPFFKERELEYDAHNCILRREIWSSGKSRAFINDTPVTLNDLKDLGAFLIDIHSQHNNLLLSNNKFQLQVVDVLADNKVLRNDYSTLFHRFTATKKQLQELQQKAAVHASEQEYLQFQYQQLVDAKLKAGEQAELEDEQKTLSNMDTIKTGLYAIEQALSTEEKGIVEYLKDALLTAQNLQKTYTPADNMTERLQSDYLDLKDLVVEIHNQQEKLDLDPNRLQTVNDRLDLLYSLQQKHKKDSVSALLELQNQLEKQLNDIANYDETIAKLQQEVAELETQIHDLSGKITETRKKAACLLEKELVERVSVLGMPAMQFQCQMTAKNAPDASGMDEIVFLFSANKNVPVKPVSQIASGGEISRLMLGIKALIAGTTALPTIIFDEIDTGVSGEVADKMGKIMHQMGEVMQVVAITHLPQIAAQGDAQFFVYKEEHLDRTGTYIKKLSHEERIMEIARMLSGAELTDAAVENAKVLLRFAEV
ncbi:DNA repair protein RecN [Bacteroidia bacterium]|nr:DNA repair protein RecN [Bacteroidia bacterium]